MSRCFPFPPPNCLKEEKILTESIKLQIEQEASKEKRIEKRRDKREKRERSNDWNENSKNSERVHKKRKHNEANELHMKDASQIVTAKKIEMHMEDAYQIAAAKKIELHMKEVATEQLERSGLTEEHGLPCLTPEPCESSESTHTSSKGRKLETISQQGSTIIRFKLLLRKHKDSRPPAIVSEDPCFSGQAISKDPEPVLTKVEEPCFSGRIAETPIERQLGESSKSYMKRRDKESKFRDLIMNWKPAPFLVDDDSVKDLGWLLDNSQCNRASSEARICSSGEGMSHGSAVCSYQPKACYLPELETYQLPFVIPF